MFHCILMTVLGFLSGAVLYAYLLPKWLFKVDVREYGEDGNPGTMSAIAAVGLPFGLLCLLLELLKAAVPVFLAVAVLDISGWYLLPVVLAPVLGHAFSPLLRFRGGKAIAAAYGSLLGLLGVSWVLLFFVGALIFFKFLIALHPHSFVTVIGFIVAGLLALLFEPLWVIKLAALFISFLVCAKMWRSPNSGERYISVGSLAFTWENKRIVRKTK